MKKLLCSFLALAMLISLAPAAFAEDTATETETQEYSGITVKYDFANFIDAASGVSAKVDYDKTFDFWKYRTDGDERDANLLSKTDYGTTESDDTVLFVKYNPANSIKNDVEGKSESDFFVAFEINVPVAGLYNVKLHNVQVANYGATANLYVFPASVEDDSLVSLMKADNTYLHGNSFEFCNETLKNNRYGSKEEVLGDKYFEKGNYVFVYAVTAANAGTGSANRQMGIKGITLDGDGDDAENAVPMSMVTSVDNTELKVGSDVTTAQMSATIYMTDLTTVTEGIAYASGDSNIATVDENGSITAKAYGVNPVKITASATIGDYTISNHEEITVNADGIEIAYNVGTDAYTNYSDGFLTVLTDDYTNGFYRYVGTSSNKDTGSGEKVHLKSYTGHVQINNDIAVAFEVYIPRAGSYTMKMRNREYSGAGKTGVYLTTKDKLDLSQYQDTADENGHKVVNAEVMGERIGDYICYNSSASNFSKVIRDEDNPNIITGFNIDEPGWYVISFEGELNYILDENGEEKSTGGYGSVGDFTLISGTGADPAEMPAMIKMGADELDVGATTTAEVIKYLSGGTSSGATASAIASSNENVVTVADGTVTAVGAGTATLTAEIDGETVTRTVTVTGEKAADAAVEEITFAATSTVDEGIKVTIPDYTYTPGSVASDIPVGTSITLEATGADGYVFRGWKRGSEADGVMISDAETLTFPLFTNTVITAIYEAETAETEASVEFYNFNGQFLTSKPVENKTFSKLKDGVTPTLTGYGTYFWTRDGKTAVDDNEIFDALTRIVAVFEKDTETTYAVTIESGISGASGSSYAYDTELELSSGKNGTWYVNGKPVAYGSAYTHYVYGKADITFEENENSKAPILSLDTEATGGARMISYDANGAEVVEVGILFGKTATPDIGSYANGKAASKYSGKNAKGQFTATGNDGSSAYARGYLIYNDGGTYRVIYAD